MVMMMMMMMMMMIQLITHLDPDGDENHGDVGNDDAAIDFGDDGNDGGDDDDDDEQHGT